MAEQNIEASPSDRFIMVPNNGAAMEVDQSHAHVAQVGMSGGPAPSMSDLALAHLNPAPATQQSMAAEAAPGSMQQTRGLSTAPVAPMAPRRMLLESAFQGNGDVRRQLQPAVPRQHDMLMNRSLSGPGGDYKPQQLHSAGRPTYEQLAHQLALYQQYAVMQNVANNVPQQVDQYGFTQQQQATAAMQAAYSNYGMIPQNFNYNNYGPAYGNGYGQQNHPPAVNPLQSMYGGLPMTSPTPEQYAAMYYNHAMRLNRLQTIATTQTPVSPSPEVAPAPKRKRGGKRVSKAQIEAEDAEIAGLTDTAPKAKRGKKSAKPQTEDDTLDTLDTIEGHTPAPKTKAKRGKKAKAPELNKNSKAWRVLQAKKLLGEEEYPVTEYGFERGMLPVPERIPSLEEIDAALDPNAPEFIPHHVDGAEDRVDNESMIIDSANGGQLIPARDETELPLIHDGYISKPPNALQSANLHASHQARQQIDAKWAFATPGYTDKSEDSSASSQSMSAITFSYSDLSQTQKYVKFNNYFMEHFIGDEAIVTSFNRVCRDYLLGQLEEGDYYKGIYLLIYLYGRSDDLVDHFKGLLFHGPDGGFKWIHDQTVAKVEANRAVSGGGDGYALLRTIEQGNGREPVSASKKKKKTPKNGFRAGDSDSSGEVNGPTDDVEGAGAENFAEDEVHPGGSYQPSSPPTLAVALSSGALADHSMSDAEEDDVDDHEPDSEDSDGDEFVLGRDEFRGGGTKDKSKKKRSRNPKGAPAKPRASEFYASQIEHVGPVYKTRRAILTREDRPYICALCGEDHRHPSDVAHHHGGSRESVKEKGCWAKHGKPAGEASKWDRHASCKVGLSDVNYTKVKDGFVILDQDSWDRIENAVAMGRQYKLEYGKQGYKVSEDGEKGDEGEGAAKVAKKGKGKVKAKAAPVVKATKKAGPTEKKAVPQHKVVKAGADD